LATREQEAGLEGVRDDDKEGGGAARESILDADGRGALGFLQRGPLGGGGPLPKCRRSEDLCTPGIPHKKKKATHVQVLGAQNRASGSQWLFVTVTPPNTPSPSLGTSPLQSRASLGSLALSRLAAGPWAPGTPGTSERGCQKHPTWQQRLSL
jgi:hypothetical protein